MKPGWRVVSEKVVGSWPDWRAESGTRSIVKGPVSGLVHYQRNRGKPTADAFREIEKLAYGKSVSPDTTNWRPWTGIVDCLGHKVGDVVDAGQRDDGIFVVGDNDGTAVLKVNKGVQGGDVFGCFVGRGEVVEEEARLEEGILEDFGVLVDRLEVVLGLLFLGPKGDVGFAGAAVFAWGEAGDAGGDAGVDEVPLAVFLGGFHQLVDEGEDGVDSGEGLDEIVVVVVVY